MNPNFRAVPWDNHHLIDWVWSAKHLPVNISWSSDPQIKVDKQKFFIRRRVFFFLWPKKNNKKKIVEPFHPHHDLGGAGNSGDHSSLKSREERV